MSFLLDYDLAMWLIYVRVLYCLQGAPRFIPSPAYMHTGGGEGGYPPPLKIFLRPPPPLGSQTPPPLLRNLLTHQKLQLFEEKTMIFQYFLGF